MGFGSIKLKSVSLETFPQSVTASIGPWDSVLKAWLLALYRLEDPSNNKSAAFENSSYVNVIFVAKKD
jgi:hypothetical protein